ncbi:uncharacterized protein PHALS_08095 [Plasmopara halstedii]|uniref:Uncharacterized protein n=1 Tax=Plasmopara halstedii TaxID=4781 RepID=A0A0P1B7P3_PLAHL|nr:uncharacterized protein PHALS_08095 [Plasmopara halstedii]CEG50383.1 hypothetical protein PHALS_08095 [Plasmopara halstedii]|eukprot:XP_024586752.1 hypothetical protein PHALS_08095 [Plasmopara halstedii]
MESTLYRAFISSLNWGDEDRECRKSSAAKVVAKSYMSGTLIARDFLEGRSSHSGHQLRIKYLVVLPGHYPPAQRIVTMEGSYFAIYLIFFGLLPPIRESTCCRYQTF